MSNWQKWHKCQYSRLEMRLKWHKKGEKGEEKAVKLSLGTFESEVLLACITKNNHKKGGYNFS